jgi:hypothetical protein
MFIPFTITLCRAEALIFFGLLISNSRSVHCPCFLGHNLAQKRTGIEDERDASVIKDGGTRHTRHIPENSV